MKKITQILIIVFSVAFCAIGESRISYNEVIKWGALRKRHTIDGESCIRVYLKPQKPEIKLEDIEIQIIRDGVVLKEIIPQVRKIDESSTATSHPWEFFLPVEEKYTEGESELVHNQEPGALHITMNYAIKGKLGSGIKKIHND